MRTEVSTSTVVMAMKTKISTAFEKESLYFQHLVSHQLFSNTLGSVTTDTAFTSYFIVVTCHSQKKSILFNSSLERTTQTHLLLPVVGCPSQEIIIMNKLYNFGECRTGVYWKKVIISVEMCR